jgi:hypothetical protein
VIPVSANQIGRGLSAADSASTCLFSLIFYRNHYVIVIATHSTVYGSASFLATNEPIHPIDCPTLT